MQIKRPLIAASVAALLALAGCSSGDTPQGQTGGPPEQLSETPQQLGEGGGQGQGSGQGQSPPAPEGQQPEPPEAQVDDVPEVVAEVNGEQITREEFIADYESQLQQVAMSQQGGGQEINQDELKQQVAQRLVDNRLLTQAASDAGIEATDEDIDATLEQVAAQSGLGSAEEVVSALSEQQGLSEEEVREEAATQFQVTTFVEQEADVTEPTEEELREQYDAMVEQMGGQGEGGQSQIPPFEQVRDQLAQQAVTQQQNAAVEEIVAALAEEGDVTIHL